MLIKLFVLLSHIAAGYVSSSDRFDSFENLYLLILNAKQMFTMSVCTVHALRLSTLSTSSTKDCLIFRQLFDDGEVRFFANVFLSVVDG